MLVPRVAQLRPCPSRLPDWLRASGLACWMLTATGPAGAVEEQAAAPILGGHPAPTELGLVILAVIALSLAIFVVWTIALRRTVARRTREIDASRAELADALARLRTTETWYRAVLECAPVGLMVVDTTGRIVLANRTADSLFGHETGSLTGRSVATLVPENVRPDHGRNILAAFDNPVPRMLTGSRGVFGQRRDGTVFPADIGLNPIPPVSGPVTEMAVSVADISDHRAMERAIADQLAFQETLFETVPLPVFLKDEAGRFLAVNRAYETTFGHRRADLIGHTLPELAHIVRAYTPQMLAAFHASDVALANTPRSAMHMVQTEIQRPRAGGPSADFLLWTVPFYRADGTPGGMIGVFADISPQKESARAAARAREAAESAAAAKSMFLANMSHEIRTPMNAVIGLAHLALRTDLTLRQRDYVEKIHQAGLSLLGIINDILDFSKIEAGRLELETIPFTLSDVIANLSTLIAPRASDKGLELLLAVDPDVPDALIGDPLRLGQILSNLASNAVKFTDQGEVCLSVSVRARTDDRVDLAFSVRDTGIGMSADEIARLFQPFSQADGSTTRRYGGTGLGLSIAHHLVERLGGDISVTSAPGRGSTFAFTIPCGLGTQRARRALPPRLANMPVLVVDDNENARLLLATALSRLGCRVTTAAGGAEALSALTTAAGRGHPVRLLLADWQMPGLNGIALARAVTAADGIPRPKTVIVTGFGRDDAQADAADSGIDGLLLKPVTDSALMDLLAELFGSADIRPDAPSGDAALAPPHFSGARVLVVEDNEINRQIAVELLASAGLRVECAANGRVAVDRLRDRTAPRIDLVLMDVQMPEMDGLTATRLIRAEPGLADLPVIALTAHALTEERARGQVAGMTEHLSKPVDPAALFRVLREHLAPFAGPAEGTDAAGDQAGPDGGGTSPEETATRHKTRLWHFLAAEADSAGRIALLLAGDRAGAAQLAGGIRERAAALGATALAQAAADVEDGIRAGGGIEALAPALSALARALARIGEAGGSAVPPARPEDALPARTAAVFARLTALLAASDGEALDVAEAERDLLARLLGADAPAFERALATYDFEAATLMLASAGGRICVA